MFASFVHRFPCALCSAVRLLSASLGGRKVPQEPPETAQGDTTERTAQKTTGKHKTDERQRSIAQPSATQNDSREPRSTAQHGTDDLTRTRFPFQRRDRFIKMVPFRVGGAVFSLLGVSWRLLARFWVPLGASAARFEAPGLPRRPPASILGAIFDAFLKIFECFFRMVFCIPFLMTFQAVFRKVSHGFCCFFVPRENGRHAKNAIPSTRKPVFSRCALAPPQRGRRRNYSKTRIKTTSNYV